MRKHYVRKCLLTAALLLGAVSAGAFEASINDINYQLDPDAKTAIVTGTGINVNELIIPSTVEHEGSTYQVTEIGTNAFRNKSMLSSVTLPEGLLVIGEYAFSGDLKLTEVDIPASVDSIGAGAFAGERVFYMFMHGPKAPRGSNMTLIMDDWGQRDVADVTAFVPSEYYDAYENPDTLEAGFSGRVGSWMYGHDIVVAYDGVDQQSSLIYTIDREQKAAAIIHRYKSSRELVIPDQVELEGQSYNVTAINDDVFIGDSWMDPAKSITSITLPSTLQRIGSHAFAGNVMIKSVTLPEGLKYIGANAFQDCFWGEDWMNGINDVKIEIPASVEEIGPCAFWVGNISVHPANKVYDSRDNCGAVIRTADNTLVLPSLACKNIPESVEGIGDYAYYNKNLSDITLPEGLKHIDRLAFARNSRLQTLTLPDGLQEIGMGAFAACDGITELHIPASVESIADYAFADCKLLLHITVDPANKVYDSREDCNAIIHTATNELLVGCLITDDPGKTAIVIPQGVKRIADWAFGDNAFASLAHSNVILKQTGYTQPTMMYLPPSVESIGGEALVGLEMLQTLIVRHPHTRVEQKLISVEGKTVYIKSYLGIRNRTTLYVPVGAVDTFLKGEYGIWTSYNLTIKELPEYTDLGFSFNDQTMTATMLKGTPDENGHLEIPATASLFGEVFPVTGIGDRAFQKQTDLVSLSVTDAITHVGADAFTGTTWLAEQPEGMVYVGRAAYVYQGNCPETLELREGTVELCAKALNSQRGLTEIILPEGLEVIAEQAMRNTGITVLTIPGSVKSIGKSAINRSTTELHSHILEPFELVSQNWGKSDYKRGIICYIPRGTLELYQALEVWNQLNLIEEDIPDAISAPSVAGSQPTGIFSIDGKQLSTPQRGLNIMRMRDGTTKKVLVK